MKRRPPRLRFRLPVPGPWAVVAACLSLLASAPAQTTPPGPAAPAVPAVPAPAVPAAPLPPGDQNQPTVGRPIDLNRYLASARTDGALLSRRAERELEFGSYPGLPLFRDLEFRVRNDALDPANLRYTLRLEPRGFGEGSAARRYGSAEVQRARQRNKVLMNRALLERYLVAVDILMWRSIHALNLEHIAVLEDRIRVLDKLKNTEDFDLADLVEAEADLTKLRAQDQEGLREQAVLEQQAALHLGWPDSTPLPDFDTTGFVSAEAILDEVKGGGYGLDTGHVYLEYLRQGLVLAESRYRMEKAEGRQYLSHISFSYDVGERLSELERRDEGKDYDLDRAIIIEAGFRLPFLTTSSQELNRRKEQFLSEREDYRQSRKEMEDIMRKDILDIHALVVQYRYLKARENEVDAQASLKKYLQMRGMDPLVLLSIKAGDLKNRIKIAEVKYGIIRNWIKVLDASGRLDREPYRNWLAAGGPEIRP